MTPSPFSTHNPRLRVIWSANSLRPWICSRMGYYSSIVGWQGGDKTDIDFGRYYHKALEYFDRSRVDGKSIDEATEEAVHVALVESHGFTPTKKKKAKSRENLVRAVIWYCDTIGRNESYRPYVFPNGEPAVELPFIIPLGFQNRYGEDYLLRGSLDGIVQSGEYLYTRERKTTGKTLSSYFFEQYSPDVQISTYDLVTSVLFPELPIIGTMVEACQVAVGFSRFINHPIRRTPALREEFLRDIRYVIGQAEEMAEEVYWPKNEGACGMYGGCEFRRICSKNPSRREAVLKANFEKRVF